MAPVGFPHSGTPGSKAVCASPGTIAACRALLRLPAPRHPPRAHLIFASSALHGFPKLGNTSVMVRISLKFASRSQMRTWLPASRRGARFVSRFSENRVEDCFFHTFDFVSMKRYAAVKVREGGALRDGCRTGAAGRAASSRVSISTCSTLSLERR